MANTYYDTTGVLLVNQCTPVIQALFGAHDLDPNEPGAGEAYIANISESSSCSWDSVKDNLEELVNKLGLALPEDSEEGVNDYLNLLAAHYCGTEDEAFQKVMKLSDFEGDAEVSDLFVIARAFNDGHGLVGYKTESGWHSDKARLGAFGGYGEFTGLHVFVGAGSSDTVDLGAELESALGCGNIDAAAEAVSQKVQSLLSGIFSQADRDAVRTKLADLIATASV